MGIRQSGGPGSTGGLAPTDKLLLTSSWVGFGSRKHKVPGTEVINKQNPLTQPQSSVLCPGPRWGQGSDTAHTVPNKPCAKQRVSWPGTPPRTCSPWGKHPSELSSRPAHGADPPSPKPSQPHSPPAAARVPHAQPAAPRANPTYLGTNIQDQGLRLVGFHLAAAPVEERSRG